MSELSITIDHNAALVLFEMLSRWSDDGRPLSIEDVSDEHALEALLASLEKSLIEPLKPDYRELLEKSRNELRRRHGTA